MKNPIPFRLSRLFSGCGLALLSASLLHAALAPIEPVVERKGSRARILILADGEARASAPGVQQALDDDANVWIPRPAADTAPKTKLKDYLGTRPWDVLYIDPAFRELYKTFPGVTDAEKQTALLARVQEQCRFLLLPLNAPDDPIPVGRCADASAPVLTRAIKAALYARIAPNAKLPEGAPSPTNMLAAPDSLAHPEQLPLLDARQIEVYRAQGGKEQFNMHPFIAHFDGQYWIIWSSGARDEDAPGQFLRYAVSKDGLTWSEPKTLVAGPDGPDAAREWSWMPGGLYVQDGKLIALGALFFGSDNKANPKKIWKDLKTYRFEWNGSAWENKGLFLDDCLVYFPPWRLADGHDLIVWRDTHGHFYTARTGKDGAYEARQPLPVPLPDYRMSETSAIVGEGGVIHLFIRDQGYTYRIYRCVSFDNGRTWTIPVKTNYPDAVSKNMSGKLSNGWYYFINNPGQARDPLAIAFSRDGWAFYHPAAICAKAPEQRYPGKFKNKNSFQYSHAIEHDGALWVVYAVNKEDIVLSRIALEALPVK